MLSFLVFILIHLVLYFLDKALQAHNEPHGPTFNARMNRQRRQRQQHGDKPVLYKPARKYSKYKLCMYVLYCAWVWLYIYTRIHMYICGYGRAALQASWKLFTTVHKRECVCMLYVCVCIGVVLSLTHIQFVVVAAALFMFFLVAAAAL